MNMVNKMHLSFIDSSYKKQEPIDCKQLRKLLNGHGITTAIKNDNLLIQVTDESILIDDSTYFIDGVKYTQKGLNEYTKLLYSIESMTDEAIIIKHNKSGYFLKINLTRKNPVWYDFVDENFERVILMYLKQEPMDFEQFKDFANYSQFRDSLYFTVNYIYTLSDFNENITILDNAFVNMPYKYSGEKLEIDESTYVVDEISYKIADLKDYHVNLYSKVKDIDSKKDERKTTRYIIKHNESGRFLENMTGLSMDLESRCKWYEVVEKVVPIMVYSGDGSRAVSFDPILHKFFKQEQLSYDECMILMNRYKVFQYIYSNNSFIYDEIKFDLRYKEIQMENFEFHETDSYYIIDGEKFDTDSLKKYTHDLLTIEISYNIDEDYKDIEYCIIKHNESGRFMKFEVSTDSYDGHESYNDCLWFEVKPQIINLLEFASV